VALCVGARRGDLCRSAAAAARAEAEERIARTMLLRRLIKNFQLSQGGHLHTFAKRAMQISARRYYLSALHRAHQSKFFLLKFTLAIIFLHS
jgi:uncharacterized protein YehS (DUF1456 family)